MFEKSISLEFGHFWLGQWKPWPWKKAIFSRSCSWKSSLGLGCQGLGLGVGRQGLSLGFESQDLGLGLVGQSLGCQGLGVKVLVLEIKVLTTSLPVAGNWAGPLPRSYWTFHSISNVCVKFHLPDEDKYLFLISVQFLNPKSLRIIIMATARICTTSIISVVRQTLLDLFISFWSFIS